jgi:hypothetical protein
MECRPLYQRRAGISAVALLAWPGCWAFQVETLRVLHKVNAIQLNHFQRNLTHSGVTVCQRSEVYCTRVVACRSVVCSPDPLFLWRSHPAVFVSRCNYCQSEYNFQKAIHSSYGVRLCCFGQHQVEERTGMRVAVKSTLWRPKLPKHVAGANWMSSNLMLFRPCVVV